jgi:palmitoyltransferase
MSISTGVFTMMTLYLLFKNLTTLEYYEYNRYRNNLEIINDSYYRYSNRPTSTDLGNIYDLGWRRNWQTVMGSNWMEWFFPITNTPLYGDTYKNQGLYFETDPVLFDRLSRNSVLQNRLLNELRTGSTPKRA